MNGTGSPAHIAWTAAFRREWAEWLAGEGMTWRQFSDALHYDSTSVLLHHLGEGRGMGPQFARRTADAFPERWGTLPDELNSILYGDAPRAVLSPEAAEALHDIHQGQLALAAGIEALERALAAAPLGEQRVGEESSGDSGGDGGDPGGVPGDSRGDGATRGGHRKSGSRKKVAPKPRVRKGGAVTGAPGRT